MQRAAAQTPKTKARPAAASACASTRQTAISANHCGTLRGCKPSSCWALISGALTWHGTCAHTLTHRLKRFGRHGLVNRTAFSETTPRVVYALTLLGAELRSMLEAMRRWGDFVMDDLLGNDKQSTAYKAADTWEGQH